jgi:hypothetical protein
LVSSFSHRWRIKCLSAYSSLQQPLAESFWVFNNPEKVPSVDPSSLPELKEFFSSCAYLHTVSMPTWQSFPFTERSTVLSSFVHSLHLLDALLAELYRTLNDSVFFFKLSAEFFLKCTAAHMLNAHLAELHRILHDSVCNCVLIHSLASKVFNNLEVFFL